MVKINKLRILVDMDDVCAKTTPKWLELYNREYNDDLTLDDLLCWSLHKYVKSKCSHNALKYFVTENFFQNLEEVVNCSKVLGRLHKQGHDIVLATATPVGAKAGHFDKLQWAKKHLPFLPTKNIITIHRKSLIRADILLDDGPHNIEEFQGFGKTCVFDQPWNRQVKSDYRISNWLEFEKLINGLNNESSLQSL